MSTSQIVFRLLPAELWQEAERTGTFVGSEHDLRDGFIHLSTGEQVVETAARHYAGQAGLVLLWVSVAALGAELRFEPSRGGALFPHLYGGLPVAAVTRVEPLTLGADGRHRFPSLE